MYLSRPGAESRKAHAALLSIVLMAAVSAFLLLPLPATASEPTATVLAAGPGFSDAEDGLGLGLDGPQPVRDALLTIVYNAGTLGELHPCPT